MLQKNLKIPLTMISYFSKLPKIKKSKDFSTILKYPKTKMLILNPASVSINPKLAKSKMISLEKNKDYPWNLMQKMKNSINYKEN